MLPKARTATGLATVTVLYPVDCPAAERIDLLASAFAAQEPAMSYRFGQRIRITVNAGGIITPFVPAKSFGTVIHPLDAYGDIGVLLDTYEGIHAYGESELVLVADAPEWLHGPTR